MSHLGPRLSALIDGELSAADRDRAHAHLAWCAACRAEAKELRELKRRMRGLADQAAGDDTLTRRLLAIAEPDGPGGRAPLRGHRGRHRRYVAIGIASCAVAGIGVTAFTMGGGQPAGPRITPPVEMYSVQHAITTGEIPFGGPAGFRAPQLTGPSQEP